MIFFTGLLKKDLATWKTGVKVIKQQVVKRKLEYCLLFESETTYAKFRMIKSYTFLSLTCVID